MNIRSISLASLLFLMGTPALACDYPARAKIVNGTSATKEEMIASQKSVKAYLAAMDEYLACIDEEEKSARASTYAPTSKRPTERYQRYLSKFSGLAQCFALFHSRGRFSRSLSYRNAACEPSGSTG